MEDNDVAFRHDVHVINKNRRLGGVGDFFGTG